VTPEPGFAIGSYPGRYNRTTSLRHYGAWNDKRDGVTTREKHSWVALGPLAGCVSSPSADGKFFSLTPWQSGIAVRVAQTCSERPNKGRASPSAQRVAGHR
jgi:hypothetical protein